MLNHLLPSRSSHTWRFFRAGGLDQVRLETGADIANLAQLDQKLWVALACPVKGLEFDEKTLGLIDTDKDGRIRVPEVLAAIKFCHDHLKSLDALTAGVDTVELANLSDATDEGKAALACARAVLRSLGKGDAAAFTLGDVADTQSILAKARFNGDGVLGVEAAEDDATKQVVADILATVGGTADCGGAMGVAQADMDAFFTELAAFDAWHKQLDDKPAQLRPLGEGTEAAALAVVAIKAKVDDFFARCRLAAFDARALAAVNRSQDEYLAIAAKDMAITADEVAGFPLARIEAGRALPLADGVNPAWTAAVGALASAAITPILGAKDSLAEAEWAQVQAVLAAHVAWAAAKPATKVEPLGLARMRAILASGAKAKLADLVAQDKGCAAEFSGIANLEKLARLHRDLFRLLHNFVSFTDFYAQDCRAVFQAGTLYLDSRSCDLCVRVEDAAKHGALAGLSKCYLAYCACTRPNGEKMDIAAVFSGGDSDYLMVGRNGVFYDRKGRDWDATITKIVENPISIRQAFFSPYKKAVRMVDEMVAKRAAAAEAESDAKMAATASATAAAGAPAPVPPRKIDLATIALIGTVAATLSAAIMTFMGYFLGLGFWIPLGLAGIILLISGPSMLVAALKLRQRNLGPILDANGWAINGRVKVNIPLGGSLTRLAEFPDGAQRSFSDPYKQKKSLWWYAFSLGFAAAVLLGIAALCYQMGALPRSAAIQLRFMGVPLYLKQNKVEADAKVADMTAKGKPFEDAVAAADAGRLSVNNAPPPRNETLYAEKTAAYNAAVEAAAPARKHLKDAKDAAAAIDLEIAGYAPLAK